MIRETPEGFLLDIKVLPRSSRCGICGIQGDALKIKVTAPPVDGRANEEIVAFLADVLGIRKGQVTITAGRNATRKVVAVTGCGRRDLERLIGGEGRADRTPLLPPEPSGR
ncbi:MAG: DUF167 domain-containing protein [Pseudomonadota bacterium]|nr:DUF167 domain-containing protein [Pseudomonadota bacterium]